MINRTKVVEYILTLSSEKLSEFTIENMARELKISRYQLWRNFKKENTESLETFVNRIKLSEAAVMLLKNNELNVKSIAEKLGYSRCDYFIKIFKKQYGTSPGRYRELRKSLL